MQDYLSVKIDKANYVKQTKATSSSVASKKHTENRSKILMSKESDSENTVAYLYMLKAGAKCPGSRVESCIFVQFSGQFAQKIYALIPVLSFRSDDLVFFFDTVLEVMIWVILCSVVTVPRLEARVPAFTSRLGVMYFSCFQIKLSKTHF